MEAYLAAVEEVGAEVRKAAWKPEPAPWGGAARDARPGAGAAPGDVLVMHPLLVPSSRENYASVPRLAFNCQVQWAAVLDFAALGEARG